ncbi:hypothetical protein BDR22DRAFT_893936 [Usnea florida]
MFYRYHSKDPWLKSVLGPFWAFQLVFLLALVSSYLWVIPYAGLQSSTDIAVVVISGICIVLVVTEIILYTATMLHPLVYLVLQLGKTITWLVFFTLADRDYIWNTSALEYGLTAELIENLVLFLTFLAALIYASTIYHRHRLAKTYFLRSVLGPDLFPIPPSHEVGHEIQTSPITRNLPPPPLPSSAALETPNHPATAQLKTKEAIEVTVLRELGGGEWNVYELPATRSVRGSKGGTRRGTMEGGSVRSLKVV